MTAAKQQHREKRQTIFRQLNKSEGFTLIEVMVAALLFAVIMIGVFGALKRGNSLIESSRDETRVTQILQSELEDLRTKNWTEISALPATKAYAPRGRFVGAFGSRYACARTISTRTTDQKEVVVSVSWTDDSGLSHSREYKTWITKGGLSDYYYRSF